MTDDWELYIGSENYEFLEEPAFMAVENKQETLQSIKDLAYIIAKITIRDNFMTYPPEPIDEQRVEDYATYKSSNFNREAWVALRSTDQMRANTRKEVSEWLPISEAPRDGTIILVKQEHHCHPIVTAEWWDGGEDKIPEDAGWLPAYGCENFIKPTHWQPLPKPPKLKEIKEDGR